MNREKNPMWDRRADVDARYICPTCRSQSPAIKLCLICHLAHTVFSKNWDLRRDGHPKKLCMDKFHEKESR